MSFKDGVGRGRQQDPVKRIADVEAGLTAGGVGVLVS